MKKATRLLRERKRAWGFYPYVKEWYNNVRLVLSRKDMIRKLRRKLRDERNGKKRR